jgi:uncharacterized damage-inducible protein DinB
MDIPNAIVNESRDTLAKAQGKIVHCLNQLSDDQLNWRPFEQQNSIANVILHLCGNLRQWIVSGVGGAADVRHRASEFSDRTRHTKQELLEKLEQTVREADQTLAAFDPAKLLEPRRVQAFDTNVLAAIFDTVSHFVGHSHEIVYITRLQLREKYKFQFVPTKEQGGE